MTSPPGEWRPVLASDGWIRLHSLSPLLLAGRYALGAVAVLFQQAQAWVLGDTEGLAVAFRLAGLALVVALATLVYAALAWRVRAYRVTGEAVEFKTGILFRSQRHLPFDRVESVDTTQPLIPRMLGLAEVRVEAVSQEGSELRLRYLSYSEAERLRLELAARSRESAGLVSDEALPPKTSTILQVPLGELLLGYVLPPLAVMASLAVVVAALGIVFDASMELAVAVVFGAIPAVATLLVRIERLWRFRLDDATDALVITRGLFNLQTQRIAPGRIQAIQIAQPPLWRVARRFRLSVDVAGYRAVTREAGRQSSILLPIAPEAVVRYALHRLEVRVDLTALRPRSVPARARWRSPLRWRSFQTASTETNAISRSGVLWRRTDIVPFARIQSARVTQGPWQRRLRLATVHFDTAGARIRAAARHRDVGEALGMAQDASRRGRQGTSRAS